jgi:SET domain-containing protein
MCFFAIKEIEKGAELTFDYNWSKEKGKKKTECLCGGKNAVVILKSKQ